MAVSRGTDRRPVRASHALAVLASVAVVAAVRGSTMATLVGLAGAGAVLAGLVRRSESSVVAGGAALFAATVVAAVGPASAESVLVGGFGAVVAADLGTFGLGIDRDADPAVATTRVELLHAVGSVVVAVLTGGVGYTLFETVPSGGSLGVVALLLGGVVLVWLLRE
ncbi:DUF7519 family protein [Halosimplex pelagicum]|uniref:Uncharacterized protein n=1 Tax=Halosimplex pelagicum TaxID=869886 RepID=A0A7D5TWR0_9EURY|nr:hypothetical protein [Halosimplex pelagicum]QLH84194.1 hypothetical protein HZS54_22275 [Halosimplex pelagicum]